MFGKDPFDGDNFEDFIESMLGEHPAIDNSVKVEDYGDEYQIVDELAGFAKDDISVRLDDSSRKMIIHARTDDGREEKDVVKLPRDADLDEIESSYNNGILSITISKNDDMDDMREIDIS